MKKVCDIHSQAYEITEGCLYCTPKAESAKTPPTSHAPGPVGCMDYLIEDKDLDTYGYYTFSNAFPIRDLYIKTTKNVTIIGDILCYGSLKFNQNLTIIGSLQTRKSIQGSNIQDSTNLEVKHSLIVGGMIAIGGNIKSEFDISVAGDIIAEDIESLSGPVYCGGTITCDNLYSFSDITSYGDLNIDLNIQANGIISCNKKLKGTVIYGTLQAKQ